MLDILFFFLMIRRPPRSTLDRSSAASDVYKRQDQCRAQQVRRGGLALEDGPEVQFELAIAREEVILSLIHISEPTRPY